MSHHDQLKRVAILDLEKDKPSTGPSRAPPLKDQHKFYGCKGRSILSLFLSYISLASIFLVPTAHCLLYGVVASFVDHILRPIAKPKEVGMNRS
jgi:hypothetical protein